MDLNPALDHVDVRLALAVRASIASAVCQNLHPLEDTAMFGTVQVLEVSIQYLPDYPNHDSDLRKLES